MKLAGNPDQLRTTTTDDNHGTSEHHPLHYRAHHIPLSSTFDTIAPELLASSSTTPHPHNFQPHHPELTPSYSNSRKRPASLMLDFGKQTAATHPGAPPPTDPDDIEMRQHDRSLTLQTHFTHTRQTLPPRNSLDIVRSRQDDAISTAQRLYDVTLDSPSSPGGGFKRMRSSADSDAGSSSCKDMDEPEVLAPDSVPALVAQIRQLLDYVASKPTLQNGSASFVRDYLRTMLLQNSAAAEEAIQAASKASKIESVGHRKANEYFKLIPDELAKHIFSFLDGRNLGQAREVCRKWNEFACEEGLWKDLCLKRWRSLETDPEAWKLIDKNVDISGPNRWRHIYPKVEKSSQWKCRLQKTGRFICNLVAHQISGTPLGEAGLPNVLIVERRFNILHLQTFVLPDASVLYFEPESEDDKSGFDDFIDYLNKRTRAGLALEDQRRFIFIPPCDYTRTQVEYQGRSLLGVVQNAYPPLAP